MKIGSRTVSANTQPTGFTPQNSPNLGPGIGGALSTLGVQVNQYAEWKAQKERQEQERSVEQEFIRSTGEAERTQLQRMREAPTTASGFTEDSDTFFQRNMDEFLSRIPENNPELRARYAARYEAFKQAGVTQAFTFEYDRTNQAFLTAQRERLSEAQTRLYEDPELFDVEMAEFEVQIQASTLSAPEKEALIDEMYAGLAQVAYTQTVEEALRSSDPVGPTDGSNPVAAGLSAPQVGLLNAIASPESEGRYNVLNGGQTFTDFSDHPRIIGAGGTTTAAGRYQFTAPTWDWMTDLMSRQGIVIADFSEVSQDRVALFYAQYTWRDYATDKGLNPDLNAALADDRLLPKVREALAGAEGARIWEGLAHVTDQAFAQKVRGGSGPAALPVPEDFDWTPHIAADTGAAREDAISGMSAGFQGSLASLISAAPPEIRAGLQLYSGFRSAEIQRNLWEAEVARQGGDEEAADNNVARPGGSQHEHGNAADLRFNGARLGEPGTEEAVAWLHENAGTYGLQFRLDNEPWHIEGTGGWTPAPQQTPGEYTPVPDAVTDPRFAELPFDTRMNLTVAAQQAVQARLAASAQRQRDLEISTHQALANAFENGEEGSVAAIEEALASNTIRDVGLRDNLRARLSEHNTAQGQMAMVQDALLTGRVLTDEHEEEVMGFLNGSGIAQGVARGDPESLNRLVSMVEQSQYVPAPMVDNLIAQTGSTNPQQAVFASEALAAIYAANPRAFMQYATEDQLKTALAISTAAATSMTPTEILDRVRFATDPATAPQRKLLAEDAAENLTSVDLDDRITDIVDTWAYGDEPIMPVLSSTADRLRQQYRDLYTEGYVRFQGDDAKAKEYAYNLIRRNWDRDPLSGAIMEFSPAAPGANVPLLDGNREWIDPAIREQLGVDDQAQVALVADAQTRREFAAGVPPTYQVVETTLDENGWPVYNIPTEEVNGRDVPRRVSMTPTESQRENVEYNQELARLNSIIDGYASQDAREATTRAPTSEPWVPGQSLTPAEKAELDRAVRQRDYMETQAPDQWTAERSGRPVRPRSLQNPTPEVNVGAAMTATGLEDLPPAPPTPESPDMRPTETAANAQVLSSVLDAIESDTDVTELRTAIANLGERPADQAFIIADVIEVVNGLPESQKKTELLRQLTVLAGGIR